MFKPNCGLESLVTTGPTGNQGLPRFKHNAVTALVHHDKALCAVGYRLQQDSVS